MQRSIKSQNNFVWKKHENVRNTARLQMKLANVFVSVPEYKFM